MTVWFCLAGEPRGKGRPRFTRAGHAYTPKDTAAYEAALAQACRSQCGGVFFGAGDPVLLRVDAYFGIPKRANRVARQDMLSGRLRPVRRPDVDNIGKAVADALNGVLYRDDAQLVEVRVCKWYGEQPRVEVTAWSGT